MLVAWWGEWRAGNAEQEEFLWRWTFEQKIFNTLVYPHHSDAVAIVPFGVINGPRICSTSRVACPAQDEGWVHDGCVGSGHGRVIPAIVATVR